MTDRSIPAPAGDASWQVDSATPDESLSLCADGDLPPDITLAQLLSRLGSEQAAIALGDAIWTALENRECLRAERLAEVQRLWNHRRGAVHSAFNPV